MRGTPRSRLADAVPSEETTVGYLLWLSRPRFWFYLAGPVLLGVIYAAADPMDLVDPMAVALFAYFLIPANIFLYGINDAFDARADAHNLKKDGREVRYRNLLAVNVAVVLCGFMGLVFLPLLPRAGTVAMAGFLLLSLAYNAPPLRFKTTPFLDSVSNGLYVLPGVTAYVTVAGSFPPSAAVVGGWLWMMGMHTFSAIPDIGLDRAAGVRTTATLLGGRNGFRYCVAVWLLAALAFVTLHPALGVLLAVYPILAIGVSLLGVDVDRACWWVPALNAAVGVGLTIPGLWVLVMV